MYDEEIEMANSAKRRRCQSAQQKHEEDVLQTKAAKGRKERTDYSFIEEGSYWVDRLSRDGYFSAGETQR